MSRFSELLKGYTDRSGVSVAALSKRCGIDRTTLHKIISGERRPPNEDFVVNLCQILMLSATERDTFLEQYEISLVGDDLYRRRRNVKAMIEKLSEVGEKEYSALKSPFAIGDLPKNGVTNLYLEKHELFRRLYSANVEAFENKSIVRIIAQPDDDFVDFMRYAFGYYKGSEIRHIFCLDNSTGPGGANDYNLELFPRVCELSAMYGNYRPMFYYDRVESHINESSLLPVLAVSDNFMFRAPCDVQSGIISRNQIAVDYSVSQFDKLEKKCYPLIVRADDISGMLGNGRDYHDYLYTIDVQPSFILLATEVGVQNNMNLSQEQKNILLERMKFVQQRYAGREYSNIFTENGLIYFMKTGVISELPERVYNIVPPERRLYALRKMIECSEKGVYDFRLIDGDCAPKNNLRINIGEEGTVHFVMRLRTGLVFLAVSEHSMRIAVEDYVTSLIESGKIYSRERSVSIMKRILSAAERELSGSP